MWTLTNEELLLLAEVNIYEEEEITMDQFYKEFNEKLWGLGKNGAR